MAERGSPPPPPPPPPPPHRNATPSPHHQLRHTTTPPTYHHRTNAQRFAPHTHRMNRRRKVQLLAGVPAPASAVITTQRTESSADPAAPAQRGGGAVSGKIHERTIRCQRAESSFKRRAWVFGLAREGGACYYQHHGEDYDCLRIQGTIQSQPLSMAAATKVPNNGGVTSFLV